MQSSWREVASWTLVLAVSVGIAGCGSSSDGRAVRGKVTLDGNPLSTGDISLVPKAGGPTSSARIENGEYLIEAEKGPTPGEYQVQIESFQPSGRGPIEAPEFDGPSEDMIQVIPRRYNSDSELTMTITPSGDNTHDFVLQSK